MIDVPRTFARWRSSRTLVTLPLLLLACWSMLGSAIVSAPAQLRPTRSDSTGPVPGETYGWRPVAIGGGGFVTGQSIDPGGRTHLARTDVFGAYLWSRKADRWVQLVTAATIPAAERGEATGGVYEVAIAPSRPERFYMAMRHVVFRTDDGGRHFARAWPRALPLALDANGKFRTQGPYMAVSPRDPSLVLLSTQAGEVWRSGDAGASWARVEVPGGVPAERPSLIWFSPSDGRAWIMVQGRGMIVSTDAQAVRFGKVSDDGPRLLRRGVLGTDGSFLGAGDDHAVWRYAQGRWTRHEVGSVGGPADVAAVAIDMRDGGLFAFTPGGRTYRSGDGGGRWWPVPTRIGSPPANEPPWLSARSFARLAIADVVSDPAVPGRLWASAGTGVFLADPPAGKLWLSWRSHTRGIEELVATGIVHPPGGIPLFTAWDFGIHARPDLDRFSTGWGPRERVLIAAQDVAWSARQPSALVTNASDTRHCCAEDGDAVLAGYSRDGGLTWRRFASLPQPPGTKADDPWAMAYGTIAVSSGDPDNIVWMPSGNRSPFYTKDNGRTWQRVVFPGEVLPFTGSYDRYPYIRRTVAADPFVAGRFLLFHSGEGANAALKGLWRTDDGGARWTRILAGDIVPDSGYSAKLRAMPGVRDRWFFSNGQSGTGDNTLRRSGDGGVTWHKVQAVEEANDIAFGKAARGGATPTIYVAGRVAGHRGIWRSVDDARTWQMIGERPFGRLDGLAAIGADPDHFGRIYLGYGGSGWLYGEPTPCRPALADRDAPLECVAVR